MRKASVSELRYDFKKIERLLRNGEEIEITKHRQVIARIIPAHKAQMRQLPDFLGRLKAIYGGKVLTVSGAELIAQDRKR